MSSCAVVGWLLVLVFGFRGQREAARRNAKGVGHGTVPTADDLMARQRLLGEQGA